MKTIAQGHDALRLHTHGHEIDNPLEFLTVSAIMVPLMVVILTVATLALEYYLLTQPHRGMDRLPSLTDVPFAQIT